MNNLSSAYLLAAVSGALLGASLISSWFVWTPWCAFAALFWLLQHTPRRGLHYRFGVLFGLGFAIVAAHWITPFLHLLKGTGYTASFLLSWVFWLYSAQLFAVASVASEWIHHHSQLSRCVIHPLVFSIAIHQFPMVFPPLLGGTQLPFPIALQAIDLVGEQGFTTILLLANAALALIISAPRAHWQAIAISSTLLLCWIGYGWQALHQWRQDTATWPTLQVGLVQPNEPPQRQYLPPVPGFSRTYPYELALSESLIEQGVDWILWPETRYKGYLDHPAIQHAYQQHIQQRQTPLLFHDVARPAPGHNGPLRSRAILLDAQGQAQGIHDKQHRVPFGEYLPLEDHIPIIGVIWQAFFGAFTDRIQPETPPGFFQLGSVNVVPLICFEVIFNAPLAEHLQGRSGSTVLAVLSSNGWFGRSRQPYQHLHAGALRAIENRLPMIHVMNNGPSAVIGPSGDILASTPAHEPGGFRVSVPYPPDVDAPQTEAHQASHYTRHPRAFSGAATASLLLCMALAWVRREAALTRQPPLDETAASQPPPIPERWP